MFARQHFKAILKSNLNHLAKQRLTTNSFALNKREQENGLKLSYYSPPASPAFSLFSDTIGQRLDFAADTYGDRESHIFMETSDRLTFQTLKENAEKLAAGLTALGFKRGDRLGLLAPNCLEWVITQFATALIGVIQVNINPAYKTNELEYALKKVDCKGIIMNDRFKTQQYVDMVSSICPELDSSKQGELNSKRLPMFKNVIIIDDNKYNGCFNFKNVMNAGGSNDFKTIKDLKYKLQCSDPINIQYTSGTTGSPKGVTLSHHMILNNAYQCGLYLEYDKHPARLCIPLPLYHCFAMVLGSLITICHGVSSVYPSKSFSGESVLKAIHEEKCTILYGTPTMFIDALNNPNFSKYNVSSINTAIMGGSICPVETLNLTTEKFNINRVLAGYGMTEASPLITMNSPNDTFENRIETIGKGLEQTEVKVVDQEGNIVRIDEVGELLVRGYNTMLGYWGEKQKTDETYTSDRFLKTGDLVKMNKEGYIKFVGRLKDLIIRGGENIYPREIEEFLHQHSKILDVYVVGVPDKRMSEELCACVKLAPNQHMTPDELREFCKDKISHFKIPKYVLFMDHFPMTVTGKIQKNILREIAAERLGLSNKK